MSEETALAEDLVARVIASFAPDAPDRAEPHQLLVSDLGYNSILLIEMAFALEELFGLDQMSLDDVPPTGAVSQVQEYIAGKVAAGEATAPTPAAVDEYLELR